MCDGRGPAIVSLGNGPPTEYRVYNRRGAARAPPFPRELVTTWETRPVCGTRVASCACTLHVDHDGPHACGCGGKWEGASIDSDDFRLIALPLFGRWVEAKAESQA